jgi:LppP/LprE lipoprotein
MRTRQLSAAVAALAAIAMVAGCGAGTKVASVKEGSVQSTTSAGGASTTQGSSSSTSKLAIVTKTVTTTSTRSSSAPAFTKPEAGSQALQAAIATVKGQGYTPNDPSEYHPEQTLRVLTATRSGSGGGYEQRAFFFVDGRYIGTDSSQPSGSIKVLAQGATSVTLAYGLYQPGESPCCPGSQSTVRFELDNGRLQALDPIPPADARRG